MKITTIKYGESFLRSNQVFCNGSRDKLLKIDFIVYLTEFDNKLILIDAGCETMPGFDMKNFIGSVKALENNGFLPESITDIVITHSHHDHIECVKYFKNAVVHIQKDEYDEGIKYIPDDMQVNIFDDRYSICDNIEIIKIGGHTKGSCIVELKDDEKLYVIAGDECYTRENLVNKIPTGTSYCPEKSKWFIDNYSNSKYTLLLSHDE